MGQTTSVVLGARRKVYDLLRTQISMSWSFPTITSFTRLATKEKGKVVWELSAKDAISNPIIPNSVFTNIYSFPMWLCSWEALENTTCQRDSRKDSIFPQNRRALALYTWLSGRLHVAGKLELGLKGWIEFFRQCIKGKVFYAFRINKNIKMYERRTWNAVVWPEDREWRKRMRKKRD